MVNYRESTSNSNEVVLSISGLSLIRSVLLKHISMMQALRSHTFEVFVSLTQCIRFYGHVLCLTFINKDIYQQLFNDVIIMGQVHHSQNYSEVTISDRERSRVCRLVHF